MSANLSLDRFGSDRPPVVLLGGVNLVRTLGLAGIPAIVATGDPYDSAYASRYCTAHYPLPPYDHAEAFIEALLELGEQLSSHLGGRVPLMYGSDDGLALINQHRGRLQRYFLFLLNEPAVADALIAKDRFQALAERLCLPVPRGLDWQDLAGEPGAVLVKPRDKADWHHTALCERLFGGAAKARIFASGREAAAEPDVARFHESLTFQEYIPGDDAELWSYHGFADESGEVMMSFVGRKIRTYPAFTGESAFIELARDETLERIGRDIARRCPLKGVFKMDFKRDPRDGRWLLLEINARYTLWHYLAARNGLNMMLAAYRFLLRGERPGADECRYRTHHRWINMQLDLRACRELRRLGALTTLQWLRSIIDTRNVGTMFAWSDPGPWLALWRGRLARRIDRAPARLALALRQWRSTAS